MGCFTIDAAGPTGLFIDPQGAAPTLNAAALRYAAPGGLDAERDCQVRFGATYDAGVLLVLGRRSGVGQALLRVLTQAEPIGAELGTA